jgi:hypothetical protein
VEWIVSYVDPTGVITCERRTEDGDEDGSLAEFCTDDHPISSREAHTLFSRIEAGLNVSVFTSCEDDEDDEDAPEGAGANGKATATAKADRRRTDAHSSDENQSDSTEEPSEWSMTRKEAAVQQPEDNENDGDREEPGSSSEASSLRAKVPRLTLDLSCTYINYSEA